MNEESDVSVLSVSNGKQESALQGCRKRSIRTRSGAEE